MTDKKLTIKELKLRLQKHRIFNTHGILTEFGCAVSGSLVAIAVQYTTGESRACRVAGTRIWSPFFMTDPKAAWYNYGGKSFTGPRVKSMPSALRWASKTYKIKEWKTSPFDRSTKISKSVFDACVDFVTE